MNNELDKIAEKVLQQSDIPADKKFGSVIAVLMIISIILTVIRVLQECNKNKMQGMVMNDQNNMYSSEIRAFSKKRGWFTKLRIKRIIKKSMTHEDYNKYGTKLTEAILNVGENITNEEVSTLLEATNA